MLKHVNKQQISKIIKCDKCRKTNGNTRCECVLLVIIKTHVINDYWTKTELEVYFASSSFAGKIMSSTEVLECHTCIAKTY